MEDLVGGQGGQAVPTAGGVGRDVAGSRARHHRLARGPLKRGRSGEGVVEPLVSGSLLFGVFAFLGSTVVTCSRVSLRRLFGPRAPCIRQSPVWCLRCLRSTETLDKLGDGYLKKFYSAPWSRSGYMFMCPSTRPRCISRVFCVNGHLGSLFALRGRTLFQVPLCLAVFGVSVA